jgi:hypothetical protein
MVVLQMISAPLNVFAVGARSKANASLKPFGPLFEKGEHYYLARHQWLMYISTIH